MAELELNLYCPWILVQQAKKKLTESVQNFGNKTIHLILTAGDFKNYFDFPPMSGVSNLSQFLHYSLVILPFFLL